jgi:SPP1 gp7 family putative phage head morphogenesis protein
MADKAHRLTDEKLEEMEKRLSAIYSRAEKEIQKTADEYFSKFAAQDEQKRKLLEQGKITEDEYKKWRKGKVMYGKRFTEMKEQCAKQLLNVNKTALAYVNGELPDVYALNYNALAGSVDGVGGYSFTLVDADTVRNLAVTDTSLLPYKELDPAKDIPWNMKKINAETLQGILQGESMDKIAKRLRNVQEMNKTQAIRSARTIVTGAENKGRQDSYARAEADGIILQKEWVATNDGRTRHSHAVLDGAIVDQDKKFDNGLMYPGDPNGRPEEVYNCRCTLVAKVNGFKKAQVQRAMDEKKAEAPQTTESAIKTANDLGVKYAQFEKMPLEQVNNAIDAVRTLPKDCVPKVIASGKDVSLVTGRPLGRKADQWWGVTYDYRDFSLRTMYLGYDKTDFDGGLIVGLNTQKFKTLDALTKAKKATNDAYFAKTGRYWSFNTDGKATAYHEIGHCFADVRGLPKGWEDASARWAEESACDLLKKPDEAFAEAWAAYHLGDKRLPDYISAIIGGLK